MISRPKISVIVPIYNVEEYLDRCVKSLLHQTLKDIEIILVDDESPDNCPALCDAYAKEDDRVKVIHKKNGGLGYARNSGLEVATGKYVAFVDSDDFIETNAFEDLYNKTIHNPTDAVFANFFDYVSSSEITPVLEIEREQSFESSKDIRQFLFDMVGTEPNHQKDRKYSMSVWHAIYSLEVIKKYQIKFPSEREMISEDIIFHIQFLSRVSKVILLPEPYYYYCANNDQSLTRTFRADRIEKFISLHKEVVRQLIDFYPDNESTVKNRADRLFISYLRHYIYSKTTPLSIVNKHLGNDYVIEVLGRYPINSMPSKYKIVTNLIKLRQPLLISIIKFLKRN